MERVLYSFPNITPYASVFVTAAEAFDRSLTMDLDGTRQNEEVMDREASATDSSPADWPYGSLLMLGSFGSDTSWGRRLLWRSVAGVLLATASTLLLLGSSGPGGAAMEVAGAVGLPLGVAAIAWAYARYLSELDELSREVQLKAFAASYGAVMTIGAALLAGALVVGDGAVTLTARETLPWLVVAEGFRGLALVVLARRYR